MAGSVNKVTLLGRLGKDPELKYTPQGTAVTKFSLATGETYTDRSGHQQDTTVWHNIVLWERLAEIANQYLKKGKQVYLEGRIVNRSYDKDGEKRYITEIIANQLVLIGDKEGGSSTNYSGGNSSYSGGGDTSFPPQQQPSNPSNASSVGDAAFGSDYDNNEDVPF